MSVEMLILEGLVEAFDHAVGLWRSVSGPGMIEFGMRCDEVGKGLRLEGLNRPGFVGDSGFCVTAIRL
ncbi:MAG: hypothetical protein DCC49_13700 [Acidobacteria bacterium]|nr:MAG: hypothetical protein DCC49_13700 [Acidobacteriota bacterium]